METRRLFTLLHEQAPAEAEATARRFGAAQARGVVAVSACLVGIRCRYDGTAKPLADLELRLEGRPALPLCPEVLAGLGTPRSPMSFVGGDGRAALRGAATLTDAEGRDCTAALAEGVARAVALARAAGCGQALLKARSPSCGVHRVHADGGLIPGCGMFTAALVDAGIDVRSDDAP